MSMRARLPINAMKFFKRNTQPPESSTNSNSDSSPESSSDFVQHTTAPTEAGVDSTSIPIVSPVSPFLWPETRVLVQSHRYEDAPVFNAELADAKTVFGLVHNLTAQGVNWIVGTLRDKDERSICLVVAIYPACATNSEVLKSLLQHCQEHSQRLKVRLKPVPRGEGRVTTSLCIVSQTGASKMVVLSSGDFSLGPASLDFLHLCFATDTALHHQFTSWFDYQWATGMSIAVTNGASSWATVADFTFLI